MKSENFRFQAAYQDSMIICILIIFGFLQTSEKFCHWFLLNVTLYRIAITISTFKKGANSWREFYI